MVLENVIAKLSTDTGRSQGAVKKQTGSREILLLMLSARTQMKGVGGHLAGGLLRASYIVYMSDYGSWYSY
jgi:hypothetical protein